MKTGCPGKVKFTKNKTVKIKTELYFKLREINSPQPKNAINRCNY